MVAKQNTGNRSGCFSTIKFLDIDRNAKIVIFLTFRYLGYNIRNVNSLLKLSFRINSILDRAVTVILFDKHRTERHIKAIFSWKDV